MVASTKKSQLAHLDGMSRWKDLASAMVIIMVTLFCYAPALHGDFLWDDDTYISTEMNLRTWSGLGQIWLDPGATEQYYPLTFTAFWLEYHLWGLNTLGYHLVNVLLHGFVALLLWQVLAHMRVRGALLAGAIFALHPVNVMSVAWMTELKNTLSGALVLGAGWCYLRFAGLGIYEEPQGTETDRAVKRVWPFYVLSLALFQLAMLAKTAVAFFPVTLFLILWWQKKRMNARDVLWLAPMAGVTIGMGVLTIYVEQYYGGASGPDFQLGPVERVLVSGRSFWFYLAKLLFPYDLTFIYPRWKIDAGDGWQYLYPLATFGLLTGLWMARGRLGKGVWVAFMHYYLTTSMLVLIVVLYMMRFSFVADHWQYFGSMGMIGLLGAAMTAALERIGWEGKPAGWGLKLGLLALLGFLTWRQSAMYTDNGTLWRTTLERNPSCWMALNNLGVELDRSGRSSEAIEQYETAIRLKPNYADAYTNMGQSLDKLGRSSEAMEQYETALRIQPTHAQAHNSYGVDLARAGRLQEAMKQLEMALQIKPDDAEVHNNLGDVLFLSGRYSEAINQYKMAVQLNPDYADAHFNLGVILQKTGQIPEAIEQFTQALRIKPDDDASRKNLLKLQALPSSAADQK